MDLSNIGEAEDRVTKLPDSLLHHILSFLDIKCAARTSILSKRWKFIWSSIPTLVFPSWHTTIEPPSLSETNMFVDFVDKTLHLHDPSSTIQKFSLVTLKHMNACQVHSWITNVTSRSVQDLELVLDLDPHQPFYVPVSLFTCESLIKLELYVTKTTHLPKIFSFPKLKSLTLRGIQFTDDNSWNEQHFADCPVLEDLMLEDCTWSDVRNFCISIATLKVLKIYALDENGFQGCVLQIDAPNLVSLTYFSYVAKEYVLSGFPTLEYADVFFYYYGIQIEQKISCSAAARKFVRALSHVESLEINVATLEALSLVDDLTSILPVFHHLEDLVLKEGITTDKSLFSLLKAAPNLTWLVFEESCVDDNKETENSWARQMSTAGCMFQHLESVTFVRFSGTARQMRWAKLILKNAEALEEIILCLRNDDAVNKEAILFELLSSPRASAGCEFELQEY